jgi:hypothetical protein
MTASRYQGAGIATFVSPNGDQIPYLRRRFLAEVDSTSPARPHEVAAADVQRHDLVAAAELGQAELSWVLADANPVMRPSELCRRVGQIVRVPKSSGLTIGGSNAQ